MHLIKKLRKGLARSPGGTVLMIGPGLSFVVGYLTAWSAGSYGLMAFCGVLSISVIAFVVMDAWFGYVISELEAELARARDKEEAMRILLYEQRRRLEEKEQDDGK